MAKIGRGAPDREFAEWVNKHRVARRLINCTVNTILYSLLLFTPQGWAKLSDTKKRRFFLDKKARVGFLEDSIIGNPLYVPSGEKSLEYLTADGGKWVGFDFHRHGELGKKYPNKKEGKLLSILPLEVEKNSPDAYTPTASIDLLSADQFHTMDFRSIDELLNAGLVRETSYEEAFEKAGAYDAFSTAINVSGLTLTRLYQVTPKGNGLLYLVRETGHKKEQKDVRKEPEKAWA